MNSESTDQNNTPPNKVLSDDKVLPRNILPDCIIPALATIFAIYYLTTITEVPWISQASAIVVSGLLLLSIAAFVIRSYRRIKGGEETLMFNIGLFTTNASINLKRLVLLALTIAYVWLIDGWGFTVTTFCFVFLGIVLLSSLANWKNAFLVALACSVIGYVVFIYFFKTRFPAGPLENWLKTILT